ncbi:MAG: ATP-binding protein [Bradymonadia bacterium]
MLVTEARQTGKTSLLRHTFPGHRFVSLDLPSEAELAESAPEDFFARHPAPLIIDEVKYAPALFRHLKVRIDADRGASGQWLLSGSQRFPLMREVGDSLAGRIGLVELDTLSDSEVRASIPGTDPLSWTVRGGFPELWAHPDIDAREFQRAYVVSYLERDLRSRLQVTNLRSFERFLRACALRSGLLLNKSDVARDVGVSVPTVTSWLGALEASGVVALLAPWFENGTPALTRSPKLYFRDTGLLLALVNLRDAAALDDSPLRGQIFETAVYGTLRRALELRGELDSLFFVRRAQHEVDFVLHRGGRFDLFECKWTEVPDPRDAQTMQRVVELLGVSNVERRFIVCRCRHKTRIDAACEAVPLEALPEVL